jgi:hypothetical protein
MKKLGELLVEREWVTRDQLTQALRHQGVFGGRLGTCLLELTLLSEDRLTKALSEQLGVPPVTQDDLRVIADGMLQLVPAKLACRTRAIPFERFGNALSVALVDPRDLLAQDELSFVTSRRLKVHVAPEVRILEALEKHYGFAAEPRYGRIWDRLNRAKYLWQEESAASSGARRRIDAPAPSAPVPALPGREATAPVWQPPPPLDSGVTRLAATGRANQVPAAEAPIAPPPVRHATAADALPATSPTPVPAVEPDLTPPTAPAPRRRWLFGKQPTGATPAAGAAGTSSPATVSPSPGSAGQPVPSAPVPSVLRPSTAAADRTAGAPAVSSRPAHPLPPADAREVVVTPPVHRQPAAPSPPGGSDVDTRPPPAPPRAEPGKQEPSAAPPAVIVAKPVETLADFERRIDEVEERDDVAHAALSFLSRRFQRYLLFMVRGETVAAWMGGGESVDQRHLGDVEVSFDEPSLFLNLREGSPFYRGPLPRLDAHQRLVRVWGGRYPKECLLLPVRIKQRLVAVVYCDRGGEDLHEVDIAEMQRVAAAMGRGFEAFLVKRKRG